MGTYRPPARAEDGQSPLSTRYKTSNILFLGGGFTDTLSARLSAWCRDRGGTCAVTFSLPDQSKDMFLPETTALRTRRSRVIHIDFPLKSTEIPASNGNRQKSKLWYCVIIGKISQDPTQAKAKRPHKVNQQDKSVWCRS